MEKNSKVTSEIYPSNGNKIRLKIKNASVQRGGLATGGGIGEVRTRAKDAVTCSVSYEKRPRLHQTALLSVVYFLLIQLFPFSDNIFLLFRYSCSMCEIVFCTYFLYSVCAFAIVPPSDVF
jgi:hypothetical protein